MNETESYPASDVTAHPAADESDVADAQTLLEKLGE